MYFLPILHGAVLVTMFATLCKPQFTVPPDIRNCKLNASSPFAWVVLITDKFKKYKTGEAPGSATQGAMLTYKAVITTATYFKIRHKADKPVETRYFVVGQRIWDWRNNGTNARTNPCSQQRPVKEIHYHPKAEESDVRRLLFDYALLIMTGPFDVTPYVEPIISNINTPKEPERPEYPWIFISYEPYELETHLMAMNVQESKCEIPILDNATINKMAERDKLIFNEDIEFMMIKFHLRCIDLLCEKEGIGDLGGDCKTVLMNRPNATMLCAQPYNFWTKQLIWDEREEDNPYAGAPLTCNGYLYGIVTQQKKRFKRFPKDDYDFFLITTILRVHPWLVQNLQIYHEELVSRTTIEKPRPGNRTLQKYALLSNVNPVRSAAQKKSQTFYPVLNWFFIATIWTTFHHQY